MHAVSSDARRILLDYSWPGNVRELEHEMERLVALTDPGKTIESDMLLSDSGREGSSSLEGSENRRGPLRERMDEVESRLLREALERNDWNQTRTAAELRLSRQGLIKKLQRHGISRATET